MKKMAKSNYLLYQDRAIACIILSKFYELCRIKGELKFRFGEAIAKGMRVKFRSRRSPFTDVRLPK